MQKTKEYNYFIDALKFIFSFIIVFYHSWVFNGEYGNGYFNYGFYAVDFYFIVTGYLMLKSINNETKTAESIGKQTLQFIKKKFKKIFPYVLFTFIISIILYLYFDLFTIDNLLANNVINEILQIGILGTGFPINSATWYISSMLLTLFCLYPLAKKYKKNYCTLICPILLIMFLLLVYTYNINVNDPHNINFIGLNGLYKGFIFILIGNITYILTEYFKNIKFNNIGNLLITILEVLLIIILISTMHYNFLGNVLVAIITSIVIILGFSNKLSFNNFFNKKVFKNIGHFGFILYLNNICIRTILMKLNLNMSYNKIVIIFISLTAILSLISYILVPIISKCTNRLLKCIKNKLTIN